MKKAFVIIGLISFSSYAMASCEDGASMAEDAVMHELAKSIPQAKKICSVEVSDPIATAVGENYLVDTTCAGKRGRTYSVSLKEIEDAVCTVIRGSVHPVRAR